MKISFQKFEGKPELGIAFFWLMTVETDKPILVEDHFIPELYYDYFYLRQGALEIVDPTRDHKFQLSAQTFKSIYGRPLRFNFKAPLILFGARFSLRFAELFWHKEMPANTFLEVDWLKTPIDDLPRFASQITNKIKNNCVKKVPAPLLSPTLAESDWLAHYSQRHKRRLYKNVFGLSKKEITSIFNIHTFLAQTCDFSTQNPRIIQYINDDYFYDQPHLNHAFKKMTGLSLLEYFQVNSILQDNLMAASYNENSEQLDKM